MALGWRSTHVNQTAFKSEENTKEALLPSTPAASNHSEPPTLLLNDRGDGPQAQALFGIGHTLLYHVDVKWPCQLLLDPDAGNATLGDTALVDIPLEISRRKEVPGIPMERASIAWPSSFPRQVLQDTTLLLYKKGLSLKDSGPESLLVSAGTYAPRLLAKSSRKCPLECDVFLEIRV